jgi:hypothetical protein
VPPLASRSFLLRSCIPLQVHWQFTNGAAPRGRYWEEQL